MRKTKEEAEITRQNLLKAALVVFSRRGYNATRLEDIADEAGVTRGALYHHFGDKESLFLAVFDAVEQARVEAIEIYVCRLRKKLEGSGATVSTLRGLGYLLAEAPGGGVVLAGSSENLRGEVGAGQAAQGGGDDVAFLAAGGDERQPQPPHVLPEQVERRLHRDGVRLEEQGTQQRLKAEVLGARAVEVARVGGVDRRGVVGRVEADPGDIRRRQRQSRQHPQSEEQGQFRFHSNRLLDSEFPAMTTQIASPVNADDRPC
jgi:AcrR family transcriptional regulator